MPSLAEPAPTATAIPEAAPAPAPASSGSAEELGALVSNEALDALNTIQVLKLASAGNAMATDFIDKLEHHLRTIIKQADGERHWPQKYAFYFQEEVKVAEQLQQLQQRTAGHAIHSKVPTPSGSVSPAPGIPVRIPSTRRAGSSTVAEEEEGEERLGNFEFHLLGGEDDEDDDAEDGREARTRSFRLLGSPKAGATKKDGAGGVVKSDVEIYNIINAEEKGGKRRKGLALGQAISHSIKTSLFSETAGSKSTKHPPAAFTHTRATEITFQDVAFSFQEYAPVIFLSIREHFGIDNEAYLRSMKELKGGQVGEGKSGMLFFSSADREFIVKTVTPNELKFLERELKSYYDYMAVNGATSLLPRFVGLYFLKLPNKPIVRLIVMNNVFKLPSMGKTIELVEMYDLKGSLHTRYVGPEEQALGKVSVLKDLNFCNRHEGTDSHGHPFKPTEGSCRSIYLGPIRKIELLANLQSDVEWLRQNNVMDYSLLLAVGFEVTPDGVGAATGPSAAPSSGAVSEEAAVLPEEGSARQWQSAWSTDLGGVRGMNGDFTERAEIYYMGVIDILQEYNAKKRAEHTIKSFTADSSKISAVDPEFYAERFINWMQAHVA